MKKATKRALSVLLSAIMVVSMLPAFAATASANDASKAQAFLTDKATFENGVTNNGVTWDDAMDAAYFDGSSSVKLNSRPLQNVTQSSGFIVSMDVYNVDNALANKYFNFTNGSQFYGCEGSSADWWTRYRSQISDGTNTRWYYTSDLNSADYTTVTAPANGNDSYPTYAWYTFTLVMNTDGSYSYYRNCELLGTYKSDYISTGNGGGLTNESAASVIAGLTDYYIGAADASGSEGFTGYIKNVRFYDEVNSENLLDLTVSEYENKMNGTVYKNMGTAYNAYVAANKALDSYNYGGSASTVTDADLAAAASTLASATNNMTEWSAYDGSANRSITMINQECGGAFSNVLYQDTSNANTANYGCDGTENSSTDLGNLNGLKIWIPTGVVLYYDGNNSNTYFPTIVEIGGKNSNNNRDVHSIYLSNGNISGSGAPSTTENLDGDFEFRQWWKGYSNWNSYSWANAYGSDQFSNVPNADTSTALGKNEATRFYANRIYYKGNGSYSNANKTIYETLYAGNSNYQYKTLYMNMAVYVIDYAQIPNAINSKKSYLSDVSSYTQGGLSSVMNAYDSATGFDMASYFSGADNSNYKTRATDAIAASDNAGYALSNASATADSAYAALRTAITDYADVNNTDSKYTAASFSAFETAYGNATAHMAALPTSGYNAETAGTLASALNTAYGNLVENVTVNFINAANQTVDTKVIGKGETLGALPGNTLIASTDSSHHNVYTWGAYTEATVINGDTVINETATETDCSFTAGAHTDAQDDENGYTTYSCTCGNSYKSYDAQNFDAYDAALVEYTGTADYETKYTADSRADYEAAIEGEKIDKSNTALSPKQIADAVSAIKAKASLLVLAPTPENTYNLNLQNDIDVNFNIDTEYYNAEDGTVEVEYVNTTDENGVISAEKETTTYPAAASGSTAIVMPVAPAQIAEPYKITVKDSNGDVKDTIETSIQDYCQEILSGDYNQKDKDVAQALLNYGALACEYFGYAEVSEAATGDAYSVAHSADYKDAIDAESFRAKAKCSVKAGVDASGKNVYVTGVSYLALIDPEFRFYVSQEKEAWAALTDVSIDDTDLDAKMVHTSNGHCVRVTGLKASDFGKTFTVTIGTYEITYNGYAFLYTALRDGSTADDSLKNLAKGVYRYAAACEAKFA